VSPQVSFQGPLVPTYCGSAGNTNMKVWVEQNKLTRFFTDTFIVLRTWPDNVMEKSNVAMSKLHQPLSFEGRWASVRCHINVVFVESEMNEPKRTFDPTQQIYSPAIVTLPLVGNTQHVSGFSVYVYLENSPKGCPACPDVLHWADFGSSTRIRRFSCPKKLVPFMHSDSSLKKYRRRGYEGG
jgi:hypothetical protein